ncbi:MAG: DegV family protein [Chloroflexi bacterium]|nr:DegV family protein [Chloroflexota bacterium]
MISIITDSDSSIPVEMAKKYGVRLVPISIQFGEDVYDACTEIDDKQVFARIDKEERLPTTAAPSPGKFSEAYQDAVEKDKADAIVCFCVSGEVSATYSAAKLAAEEFSSKVQIEVIDTRSLTMAQGYMALAAAEAAKRGKSIEQILAAATATGKRAHVYGALNTLKYLSMSGRVSHLAAGMAGMLNIKPILSVQNGKLDLLEKIRTRKKSWLRVIELAQQDVGDKKIEKMCILHVTADEEALEFEEMLRKSIDCPDEMPLVSLNPGLSIHTGAGLVGISFVVAD